MAGSHGVVDLRPEHRDNDRPSRTLTRKPGPGGTLIQVPVAAVGSTELSAGPGQPGPARRLGTGTGPRPGHRQGAGVRPPGAARACPADRAGIRVRFAARPARPSVRVNVPAGVGGPRWPAIRVMTIIMPVPAMAAGH